MTAPRETPEGQALGAISCEFTIWCGACALWDQVPGPKSRAIKNWRRVGWSLTSDYGWMCKDCQEKKNGKKKPDGQPR